MMYATFEILSVLFLCIYTLFFLPGITNFVSFLLGILTTCVAILCWILISQGFWYPLKYDHPKLKNKFQSKTINLVMNII